MSEGVVIILFILGLVYALLLFLLPVYVFNIRNLLIKQNQMLEDIVINTAPLKRIRKAKKKTDQQKEDFDFIKTCPNCGSKNNRENYTCMACNKPI